MLTYATGDFPGLCIIYGSVLEGISGQNTTRDFAAESVAARRAIPFAQGEGV